MIKRSTQSKSVAERMRVEPLEQVDACTSDAERRRELAEADEVFEEIFGGAS